MKTLLLSLLGVAIAFGLLFVPSTAEAAKGQKKKGHDVNAMFEKLDADKDGKLSPSEFAKIKDFMKKKEGQTAKKPGKGDKVINALFAKLDTNKDGYLSKEEFAKLHDIKKSKKNSK
jgi:Ca2+-binding EF-hand superfamily protein